ncbi:hypothetical protein [Sandaracinus amylolyticus]|uniref:Uncharacterized protein n=1 Tax=Sandaracinus amylolyticus TaxID=927083 RepID=A0A0F6YIX2_9BACT|nr:hypothetical protein [Sandaracinus amylolyticus]AKF07470.1 hypothetical protein DB32_004619 [Sandaracinus amylolyticus]
MLAGWRDAGLARELDARWLTRLMSAPPTDATMAMVLAAHYHASGDPVERAWRAQSDRVLELADEPTAPEALAGATQLILPEVRIATRRTAEGLEVRLATERETIATTRARVTLRRMQTHARSGRARPVSMDGLPPRSFVYALNVLLESKDVALRFVPLVAMPGRRAWIAVTLAQALHLEDLQTLDADEPWRPFARFVDSLALAS